MERNYSTFEGFGYIQFRIDSKIVDSFRLKRKLLQNETVDRYSWHAYPSLYEQMLHQSFYNLVSYHQQKSLDI